jgi:hypothetical protein
MMALLIKKKRRNELARVREALDKGRNPMSQKVVHFIQTGVLPDNESQ